MKTNVKWLVATALVFILPAVGKASDSVGIYVLVEKVVMEPNEDKPERIQVWGVFSLAKQAEVKDGKWDEYGAPVRGYMYFSLAKGDKGEGEACRKEWADLKSVAGKNECIGFGRRWTVIGGRAKIYDGTVRKVTEKPDKPDIYPIGWGLHKLKEDTDYEPVKRLFALPKERA